MMASFVLLEGTHVRGYAAYEEDDSHTEVHIEGGEAEYADQLML